MPVTSRRAALRESALCAAARNARRARRGHKYQVTLVGVGPYALLAECNVVASLAAAKRLARTYVRNGVSLSATVWTWYDGRRRAPVYTTAPATSRRAMSRQQERAERPRLPKPLGDRRYAARIVSDATGRERVVRLAAANRGAALAAAKHWMTVHRYVGRVLSCVEAR